MLRVRSRWTTMLAAVALMAAGASVARPDATPAPATSLNAQFGQDGLTSLKWGDSELVTVGQPELLRLKIKSVDVGSAEFSRTDSKFDPASNTLDQTYGWGKFQVVYKTTPGSLIINVTASNTGSNDITDVGFFLMHVQLPVKPDGVDWQNRYPIMHDREDNIPVLKADWPGNHLAFCNDDLDKLVSFGFQPLPDGQTYGLEMWFNDQPIKPGESRSAVLSIRLAGTDKPGWAIAHDVLAKYAAKYPMELKWDDHRPIATAFLATSEANYKNNPRGWFLNPNLDTTTDTGRAEFHTELMKYADAVVANCKLLDAQGVIVWDLEGQEMPHPISYLADPRTLAKTAPEMDAVADEFFKRLSDGGLKTGVTVRPSKVVAAADGKGWTQQDMADPIAEMTAKIDYARKRWGCTLFYLDSNVDNVRDEQGKVISDPPMAVDPFREMAKKYPGCLLIPEHHSDRYWAYTAPYNELRLGYSATPPQVREAYPRAFSVLRVVDGPSIEEKNDELVQAVRQGDILLFRAWWDDPENAKIKHIYEQAKAGQGTSN